MTVVERNNEYYSSVIFLNAALPLLKVIVAETKLAQSFATKSGKIQFAFTDEAGVKQGCHFSIEEGEWQVLSAVCPEPVDVELYFADRQHFNRFFKGQSKKLPQIKGWWQLGLLLPLFRALLKMQALLSAKVAPPDEATQLLLIKALFYLLSAGISQLNKAGHPVVRKWTQSSPDRVFAWSLTGHPDIAAYVRIKAGNSKAVRGSYERSQPFFTMRFADPESALGILLQTADLLQLTATQKLIMEGAPEFGAKIGDMMMLVGELAQP